MKRCNLWSWGLAGSLTILVTTPTLAQITPDGTLPNNSTVRQDIIKGLPSDVIEGGTQRGGNLFHSFSDFNVDEGRGAYFANPAGVDNILSRVTGGNPSLIFGTLGVLGGANLYFLNPSGIFFGSNSKLDIQGSFIGTTADGIYLGDEGSFNASEPQNSNLLSINPGVLFFNQVAQQPGNIINQGILAVGRDLTLSAGGDLTVGGQLTAGGNLTLQGLNIQTSAQLVSGGNFQVLQLDGNLGSLSSIDESANRVSSDASLTSASANGTVIRSGGDVFLDSYTGASLHILAGGKVEIPGYIQIEGSGANGLVEEVTLSDGITKVNINGQTQPTLDIRAGISNAEGPGTPTNADINVGTIFFEGFDDEGNPIYIAGTILLTNQYQPNTNLAGNIQIASIQNAKYESGGIVNIDSRGSINITTFIEVSALDTSIETGGNGGNITMLAVGDIITEEGSFILSQGKNGGQITLKSNGADISSINAQGNNSGGSVTIIARGDSGDIEIDSDINVSAFENSQGIGGNVSLEADGKITLDSGGIIDTSIDARGIKNTKESSAGGRVTINANSDIQINDDIDVSAFNSGSDKMPVFQGDGGNITLTAGGKINFAEGSSIVSQGLNGGKISLTSSSASLGSIIASGNTNGGSVTVNATSGEIKINRLSLINASSENQEGAGGKIKLMASGEINFMPDSAILATSPGNGGQITLDSDSNINIRYINANSDNIFNSIDTRGDKSGGTVTINALGDIWSDGEINVSSDRSKGGNITLTAGNQITLNGQIPLDMSSNHPVSIAARGNTEGGSVTIKSTNSNIQSNSDIDVSSSGGNGGIINLTAGGIINTENSSLLSIGQGGNGGQISLTSNSKINTGLIDARGNIGGGSVTLDALGNIQINGDIDVSAINMQTSPDPEKAPPIFQGNGGNIILRSGGAIDTQGSLLLSQGKLGGQITLSSNSAKIGSIDAGGIDGSGSVMITTSSDVEINKNINVSAFDLFPPSNQLPNDYQGNGGNVTLNAGGNIKFAPGTSIFSNGLLGGQITLNSGATIFITGDKEPHGIISNSYTTNSSDKGGTINIAARSLVLKDGGVVVTRTFGTASSGDIIIKAPESVKVIGTVNDLDTNKPPEERVASNIITTVQPQIEDKTATGNGGNISIETGHLILNDGGQIFTGTFSDGNAGNITITATNMQVLGITDNAPFPSGLTTSASTTEFDPTVTGSGGNITLNTNRLMIANGGLVGTYTFAIGNSGNVDIKKSAEVEVSGTTPDGKFSSSLFTFVGTNGTGNSGNLTLNIGHLRVSNRGQILTGTQSSGNAGNIDITATKVELFETVPNAQFSSSIFTVVDEKATGNSGNIILKTGSLSVRDGTSISVSGAGTGKVGNLEVKDTQSVDLIGAAPTNVPEIPQNPNNLLPSPQINPSQVQLTVDRLQRISLREGQEANQDVKNPTNLFPSSLLATGAGNITLGTESLSIKNGAQIFTSRSDIGGNITITSNGLVEISGTTDNLRSAILTSVAPDATEVDEGGNLNLTTQRLIINKGAIDTGTIGSAPGGDLIIKAFESIELTSSQLSTLTESKLETAGIGGDIEIETGNLILNDSSQISSRTLGQGDAGNILIKVDGLLRATDSNITASTSGQGDAGDITIEPRNLIIPDIALDNSQITTAVNPNADGQGGNIKIEGQTITLSNNSIIKTSSEGIGDAGSITIPNAQTISLNQGKITASTSGRGDTGIINLNANGNINLSNNSEISSAVNEGANGNAQAITLNTPTLNLRDSKITASTSGQGNAGSIDIAYQNNNANTVNLDNSTISTAIQAGGVATTPSNITIKIGNLNLLNNSTITASTSGQGDAGSITVPNAQTISLNNGKITASTSGVGNTGVINLNANENIELSNSQISSSVEKDAQGNAQTITLNTPNLSLTNQSEITAFTNGQGNAGSIDIAYQNNNANTVNLDNSTISTEIQKQGIATNPSNITIKTETLNLLNNSTINASTSGQGDAGSITVPNAHTISLNQSSITASTSGQGDTGVITLNANENINLSNNSEISSAVEAGARGDARTITLNSPSLSLKDSQITASTDGQGNAGSIEVPNSQSITLDNSTISTAIEKGGVATQPSNITLNMPTLTLRNNAQITANTAGQGDAGNINLPSIQTLNLQQSEITVSTSGKGNAGSITIPNAQTISLNQSRITASTSGQGDTGVITLNANENINLSNNSEISSAVGAGAVGNAQTITLNTPTLTLKDSNITASTDGQGNAGSIEVPNSQRIALDNSTISTAIEKRGIATQPSNITLNTRQLELTNSQIQASSIGQGNAGNINIKIGEQLQITDSQITTSTEQASGGKIEITAPTIRMYGTSSIRTNVEIGAGDGGNITIKADDSIIAFDNSDIIASARDGKGGDISLDTPVFLGEGYQQVRNANQDKLENNGQVDINASGGIQDGTIRVPNLNNILNSLVKLPTQVVDTEQLLARSCVAPSQDNEGKFIVTGASGLPDSPGGNSVSMYPTEEVRTVSSDATSSRSWKLGDLIIEPQGVYHLSNGKVVLSRECQ